MLDILVPELDDVEPDVVVLVLCVRGLNPQKFVVVRPHDDPSVCQLPSTEVGEYESADDAAAALLELLLGKAAIGRPLTRIWHVEEGPRVTLSMRGDITPGEISLISDLPGFTTECIADRDLRRNGLSRADFRLMQRAHRDSW